MEAACGRRGLAGLGVPAGCGGAGGPGCGGAGGRPVAGGQLSPAGGEDACRRQPFAEPPRARTHSLQELAVQGRPRGARAGERVLCPGESVRRVRDGGRGPAGAAVLPAQRLPLRELSPCRCATVHTPIAQLERLRPSRLGVSKAGSSPSLPPAR